MTNILVKFGGSEVTNKGILDFPKTGKDITDNPNKYLKLNVIESIASSIHSAKQDISGLELVLITGAGCCGHPQVKAGFPPATIHEIACMPALYLQKALFEQKVQSNLVSPYVSVKCVESANGQGITYDINQLWHALRNPDSKVLNMTWYAKMSHGDVVPMAEGKKGRLGDYEVISGDDLVTGFATMWPADQAIMVSNVKGIYRRHPAPAGESPVAKIIADEKIRDNLHFKEKLEKEYNIKLNDINDVTGGIIAKARKLYDMTYETGIKSQIIGIKGLEAALKGKHVGTLIEKG